MNEYLTASELADLVGCKLNQRSIMIRWLENRRWKYVADRNGLPKVARAYQQKKLGVSDEPIKVKYATSPNLELRCCA